MPQFGPPEIMHHGAGTVFREPKWDPTYYSLRVASLGHRYLQCTSVFCPLEESRRYIESLDAVNGEVVPYLTAHQDLYFVSEEELRAVMYKEHRRYSWALAILYRLISATTTITTRAHLPLDVQLFLDSHLELVNYVCRSLDGPLTNDQLEQLPQWSHYVHITDHSHPVHFGDLPDSRNFVDFFFYGDTVKIKTEDPFSAVAHCLFCKTVNRKCANRDLMAILVKKFQMYPFLRSLVRMILCVGLLGNYRSEKCRRLPFNQRWQVYWLTDYRQCPDSLFDQWISENTRLCEILLREHQNQAIQETHVFDQLMHEICDRTPEDQWTHIKASTLRQCNMIRESFQVTHPADANRVLAEINDRLRMEHDEDLDWTIPKPSNFKDPLYCQLLVKVTAEQFTETDEGEAMLSLDKHERWPPCDENVRRLSFDHGQRCFNGLQRLRYHLYTYRPLSTATVKRSGACAQCVQSMAAYLCYRGEQVDQQDVFIGADVMYTNLQVYRKKNDIADWEEPPVDHFASLYCDAEFPHWLSASVSSIKDQVPMHICGVTKVFFDPWRNETHCGKDNGHSLAKVRRKFLYGKIVTMGNRRWTLCVKCGVIIPFDTFVLTTDGPACVRHSTPKPVKRWPSTDQLSTGTTERLYLELYPPTATVPLERVFVEEDHDLSLPPLEMLLTVEEEEEAAMATTDAKATTTVKTEEDAELPEVFKEMILEQTAEETRQTTVATPAPKFVVPKHPDGSIHCLNCDKEQRPKARKLFTRLQVKDSATNLHLVHICPTCRSKINKYLNHRQGQVIDIEELKHRLAAQYVYRKGNRQRIPEKYMK